MWNKYFDLSKLKNLYILEKEKNEKINVKLNKNYMDNKNMIGWIMVKNLLRCRLFNEKKWNEKINKKRWFG